MSRLITVLAGLLLLRPHICQQERWLSGDVAVELKLGLSKSANILVLSPRWFLDGGGGGRWGGVPSTRDKK